MAVEVNFEMDKTKIERALQSATDTKEFLIDSGSILNIPDIFKKHFPDSKVTIVADDNTYMAAGRVINDKLKSAGLHVIKQFVFPGLPMLHADYKHVENLRKFLIKHDAIAVAVGSGTINDIVKLASQESNQKYIVAPTAASVDGYSAFGASILMNGFKQTIKCAAPLAIVADIQILKNAPPEMTAAGYADLLGKITAGADWIISDSIDVEDIGTTSWKMVQKDLRKWISQPKKLLKGDSQAIENLFEGLIMSGLAMQTQRSSRPASGTEHLFSHTWEMQNLKKDGIPISHGFKVGIGTLAASAIMETIFSKEIKSIDIDNACVKYPSLEEREKQVRNAFSGTMIGNRNGDGWADSQSNEGKQNGGHRIGRRIVDQTGDGVVDMIVATSLAKHLTKERLRDRLKLIRSQWNDMRLKVRNQLLPFSELKEMLASTNCPITPDQINLSREQVKETFFLAQMIRERYTVLDLAYELGWLEDCVEETFSSGAYL